MTNKKFDFLFNNKPRDASKEEINQFHMDLQQHQLDDQTYYDFKRRYKKPLLKHMD